MGTDASQRTMHRLRMEEETLEPNQRRFPSKNRKNDAALVSRKGDETCRRPVARTSPPRSNSSSHRPMKIPAPRDDKSGGFPPDLGAYRGLLFF